MRFERIKHKSFATHTTKKENIDSFVGQLEIFSYINIHYTVERKKGNINSHDSRRHD